MMHWHDAAFSDSPVVAVFQLSVKVGANLHIQRQVMRLPTSRDSRVRSPNQSFQTSCFNILEDMLPCFSSCVRSFKPAKTARISNE